MTDEPRVVTLLPSATEICAALGVAPVGVSHECDHPPAVVADARRVTRSRIPEEGDAAAVNDAVAAAVDEHGGVTAVDAEAIAACDPDVVVTQDACDVCAAPARRVDAALDAVDGDPTVIALHSHTLEDVLGAVQEVGGAIGREDRAAEVVADLDGRMEALRDRTAGLDRPRLAVIEWTDPVMVGCHWVPELVEAAGGMYSLAEPGQTSEPREWDEIRDVDPEVLVCAPCGFELPQAAASLDDLAERPGWADLPAVRDGRVWAMDGHHLVNRPGPRLVDTAEHLAQILHPTAFGLPPNEVAQRPVKVR